MVSPEDGSVTSLIRPPVDARLEPGGGARLDFFSIGGGGGSAVLDSSGEVEVTAVDPEVVCRSNDT